MPYPPRTPYTAGGQPTSGLTDDPHPPPHSTVAGFSLWIVTWANQTCVPRARGRSTHSSRGHWLCCGDPLAHRCGSTGVRRVRFLWRPGGGVALTGAALRGAGRTICALSWWSRSGSAHPPRPGSSVPRVRSLRRRPTPRRLLGSSLGSSALGTFNRSFRRRISSRRPRSQGPGPAFPLGGVLLLGRASAGEERAGPRHALRARSHAPCARLRVAPVPILRIAFHTVRLLPGLIEQHRGGRTQA